MQRQKNTNSLLARRIQQNRNLVDNIFQGEAIVRKLFLTGFYLVLLSCTFFLSEPSFAQWRSQKESNQSEKNDNVAVLHSILSKEDDNRSQSNPQQPIDSSVDLEQILAQGTDLEKPVNGRKIDWNEALRYWEIALRENPSDLQINRRFYRARINYDIDRRLADKDYIEHVSQLPLANAHQLLNEILIRIENSYVDSINWASISHNGLVGVQQALRNPAFCEQYFSNVSKTKLTELTSKWLTDAMNKEIHDSEDVARQVISLGSQAQNDCQVNASILIIEYICGFLDTLDPYTGLLTTSQLADMYNQINGSFVGIGVELKMIKGQIRVIRPITDSPAQRAGIQAGDTIVSVDGHRVEDSSPEQVANRLQGAQGSRVQIEIARRNVPNQNITLVRQSVKSPSIDNVKIIDTTSKIGYLRLNNFQRSTADELDSALHHLYEQNMRRLIIDLRGNPGGLLQSSIDVSSRFLTRGTVVSTKGKDIVENETFTVQETQTWNVPLVLLIDQNSASAAEIFSGAMRDYRRARIVGTKSYGKGSVQGIFPLKSDSMGLRMTTAKFYSPQGKGFSRVGVSPDTEVHKAALLNGDEDSLIPPSEEDDAILQAGLSVAREME